MQIHLNSEPKKVEDSSTLEQIMQQFGFANKKGIAIALNEVVIPQKKWAETILNENDKLLIITAFQGG